MTETSLKLLFMKNNRKIIVKTWNVNLFQNPGVH